MNVGTVTWRARCDESRTSGSEGGPGRRMSRNARTAPRARPYYGDALWKGAAASVIGVEDLRRLRPRILHALDRGFFEARYARGSARERELLRLIARHGESATLRQLSTDSGLMNNQLQPVISNMLRKGLIYRPSRATLAFTAPMFGAHIRRRGNDKGR